eukprot:TRINITY_DN17957_c0_g2_i1.p1 TRINITY_DN17957_c0_g2~~TRINITY_DN17957_c0_g2_i1.p1  ORF type:complete len:369 (-),score=63.29 TRINITY_DN17957_c0_g2_i1:207-1313(-)
MAYAFTAAPFANGKCGAVKRSPSSLSNASAKEVAWHFLKPGKSGMLIWTGEDDKLPQALTASLAEEMLHCAHDLETIATKQANQPQVKAQRRQLPPLPQASEIALALQLDLGMQPTVAANPVVHTPEPGQAPGTKTTEIERQTGEHKHHLKAPILSYIPRSPLPPTNNRAPWCTPNTPRYAQKSLRHSFRPRADSPLLQMTQALLEFQRDWQPFGAEDALVETQPPVRLVPQYLAMHPLDSVSLARDLPQELKHLSVMVDTPWGSTVVAVETGHSKALSNSYFFVPRTKRASGQRLPEEPGGDPIVDPPAAASEPQEDAGDEAAAPDPPEIEVELEPEAERRRQEELLEEVSRKQSEHIRQLKELQSS